MRRFSIRGVFVFPLMIALTFLLASSASAKKQEHGIFQKVLVAAGGFEQAAADLEKSIADSNLELLAKMDIRVPENAQKCRTYILTSPALNQAAQDNKLSHDAVSVLILRIGLYEAYGKIHINMANLDALANVYFEDEKNRKALMAAAAAAKTEMVRVIQTVPGKGDMKQQAPVRKAKKYRGYNGDGPAKMMAKWRDFRESLLTSKEIAGSVDLDSIIRSLNENAAKSLRANAEKGWKVVTTKTFNNNVAWMGISNRYSEVKVININSDFRSGDKTQDTQYPGVDHAPAMPLELIIYKAKNGKWQIAQYGEMWRMQLYFWDSGYRAFAKNTLVPSIIFSDIEDMVNGRVSQ